MSVEKKVTTLRSVLESKTTEELEELLALDFAENQDGTPNVDYIMEIMEVIGEREATPEREAETEAAWQEFQEYMKEYTKEENRDLFEADEDEDPILDQFCTTEHGQKKSRKPRKVLRTVLVAAVVLVLACGTISVAAGWNPFQAVAEWGTDIVRFFTGTQGQEASLNDPFRHMRLSVENLTNTPAVPTWAPKGTAESGQLEIINRKNQTRNFQALSVDETEFTILIIVYDKIPENYSASYQRDESLEEPYSAGGITHYITDNNGSISVMWTNGVIEGHIQGNLSMEDAQKMIDSIYKE